METIKTKFKQKIGKKIKKYRNKAGLTQKELGELVGYSTQSIGLFEVGKDNPNLQVIYKICLTLKCGIMDILPPLKRKKKKRTTTIIKIIEYSPHYEQT